MLPNEEGAILMNHIEVAPSLNKDEISNDRTIPLRNPPLRWLMTGATDDCLQVKVQQIY